MELAEFDTAFEGYLKERFGAQASSLRLPPDEPQEGVPAPAVTAEELRARAEQDDFDFIAHLETGRQALEAGETERAEKHLERAQSLFPSTARRKPVSAARSDLRGARRQRAAKELQTFVDINENHYDAHLKLFEIYQKLGTTREAASILERAIAIYPFDADAHRKLAPLYQELGRKEDVVVERRALVALTTDRAQGLYELALAYYEAGDARSAKRELLRALEIAPGFKDGLALLMKLSARSEG
jgi:tetratricopeptide (TPR) repeat protein